MKNISLIGIGLLAFSAMSVQATPVEYRITLSTFDSIYTPDQLYDVIGSETDSPEFNVQYATLRDGNETSGLNDASGVVGAADDVFSNIDYATQVDSIDIVRLDAGGSTNLGTYEIQPLYVDFRLVFEEVPNDFGTFNIISEYSFFDILTQNDPMDDDVPDWGLGLDLEAGEFGANQISFVDDMLSFQVSGTIAAEIFDEEGANNLPFAFVDSNLPIFIGLNDLRPLNSNQEPDWANDTVRLTGESSITFTIPEPGSLGILGLSLAGLGFLQRRRRVQAEK